MQTAPMGLDSAKRRPGFGPFAAIALIGAIAMALIGLTRTPEQAAAVKAGTLAQCRAAYRLPDSDPIVKRCMRDHFQ